MIEIATDKCKAMVRMLSDYMLTLNGNTASSRESRRKTGNAIKYLKRKLRKEEERQATDN